LLLLLLLGRAAAGMEEATEADCRLVLFVLPVLYHAAVTPSALLRFRTSRFPQEWKAYR